MIFEVLFTESLKPGTMKSYLIPVTIAALLFASCSSSRYMYDDAYYNPKDEIRAERKTQKQTEKNAEKADEVPVTEAFAAAEYTEPAGEVMGVYNGDTLALETFEFENGDKDVVVNNYYEGSASYTDYGSRLSRFYGPSIGMGYYSPYYTGYSPYYYDPFFYPYYSPYYYPRFSFGISFGWGYGYNYFPTPYYPGYYGGGYSSSGFGSSGVYISEATNETNPFHSTRRRGSSTARRTVTVTEGDKGLVSTPVAGRRNSTTNAVSTQNGTTASSLRRNEGLTRNGNQERTIPQREGSQTGARRASNTINRSTAGTQTASGTRVIKKSDAASNRTTNTASNRRYVPRYSNPRTTAKPNYNNSRSKTYNGKAPSKRRAVYTAPARRSNTGYSAPSRSRSFPGSGVMSSGRSGGTFRSSGTSGRSGGAVRSSGSSSRSSGSTSRSSSGRRK